MLNQKIKKYETKFEILDNNLEKLNEDNNAFLIKDKK